MNSSQAFELSFEGMLEALKSVNIASGDTVLIHSDLRPLGIPKEISSLKELPAFYHRAFLAATDPQGTLAVPAYFYEYARFGIPFDVDHSPVSISLGSYSRYLTGLPGRLRSCNPLQSLAALGPQSAKLVGSHSLSGYGVTSPWHYLRKINGKILFVGLTIQPMTYIHYVEQLYGVPHMYCKIYSYPVMHNGIELHGNPISSVRYLDYHIEYDLSKFESVLEKQGCLKSAQVGNGTIRCVEANDVFDIGISCLDKDPYFFLKHPPHFVPGKIPCDGMTGPQI